MGVAHACANIFNKTRGESRTQLNTVENSEMYWSLFLVGVAAQLILTAPLYCATERKCNPNVFQRTCSNFFHGVGASSGVEDTNRLPPASIPMPSLFPNARNLSIVDAMREFSDFDRILELDNYCSYLLHSFLCIHYFSPCDPSSEAGNPLVVPCREICVLAMGGCLDYVFDTYLNISLPEHLNCSNFPTAESANNRSCTVGDDFIVACPTPGI